MSLGLGVGLPRGKYIPPDFAVTFNGVDEYLTLPLPNNDLLASPGVGDFYSSGIAIAGWDANDVVWNSGVSGKTYTETITIPADRTLSKTISGLIVGQKYKLKLRYQAAPEAGFVVGSDLSTYFELPQSNGEWNTVSKIFTADSTTIMFGAPATGDCILDWASVKRDQGLDVNKDQEMILYSGDANFNNPTTRWVAKDGSSNQTCALSTVDKAEGTGSLLITSTGVGDATNNYVMLPPEFLESCIAGKKYTIEGKGRLDPASLVYGSNLIANGTDWTGTTSPDTYPTNWQRSTYTNATQQGVSVVTGNGFTGNALRLECLQTSSYYTLKTVSNTVITSGKTYKLSYKYRTNVANKWKFEYGRIGGGEVKNIHSALSINTGDAVYVEYYFTATSNGELMLWSISLAIGEYIEVDEVVLIEATPVSVTHQIGTKSVTSALSIVQGSFTKFVLNFVATGSEVNAAWKSYLSGVGAVFVDGLSLTPSFDLAVVRKFKINAFSGVSGILGIGTSNAGDKMIDLTASSTGLNSRVRDSDSIITSNLIAITTGFFYSTINVMNRVENLSNYVIGGSNNSISMSNIGKVIFVAPLKIGLWAASSYLNGQIATVQIIRFDNIALTDFNPNTYQPGHAITDLGGGVPEVVLHLDPRDGSSIANMLKDYSSKGHVITAVNIDLSNRVVVRN